MESQPQNPEFRINPGNFHPCFMYNLKINRRDMKDALLRFVRLICVRIFRINT